MPSSDDLNRLRPVYERELQVLGERLREYTKDWPDAAQQLELSGSMPSDPDMARLLEGFAYLCARLQMRLDDGYESLCFQLLKLYFPDFLKPVPSMGVVKFDTSQLKEVSQLVVGTEFALVYQGRPFRFQVRKDAVLLPLRLFDVAMQSEPFPNAIQTMSGRARSALCCSVQASDNETPLSEVIQSEVSIYFNPEALRANELLDLVAGSLTSVVVVCDNQTFTLPVSVISWPLFDEGAALLPADSGLFEAQRLLRDFFIAPDLFRFMHLDLSSVLNKLTQLEVSIWFMLDDASYPLEKDIGSQHLLLGCTPIANIYPIKAEPLRLDHTTRDVPIRLGVLYQESRIYDIQSVKDVTEPSHSYDIPGLFQSFYKTSKPDISWQCLENNDKDVLQFMDVRSHSAPTIRVFALNCLGYDPSAGDLPVSSALRPVGDVLPCDGRLLKATSRAFRHDHHPDEGWRLLSALQLNVRSLRTDTDESDSLKKILSVFIRESSSVSRKILDSINGFICHKDVRPCRTGSHYFISQGCHYQLKLDVQRLEGVSTALFLNLLDRILNYWRPFGTHSRLTVSYLSRGSDLDKTIQFPVRTDG